MNDFTRDPARDPEIGGALAEADPTPLDAVDWDALHRTIVARAELPLARRRSRRERWWGARSFVPAAAAAALAAVFATQVLVPGFPGRDGAAVAQNGMRVLVEDVLNSSLSDAELDLLLGNVSADGLVMAAMTDP